MNWKNLLAVVVSLLFLWLALRNFQYAEFQVAVRQMNPWFFLPGVLVYFASMFLRALRWQRMLRPIKPMAFGNVFRYIILGYMANNLLPARLGEVIRAYVTGKREGVSRSASFASVVLERLFDGSTVVLILVVLLFFFARLDHGWLWYTANISLAVFLGGLCFLFLLVYKRTLALRILQGLLRPLPCVVSDKLLSIVRKFMTGLDLLRSPLDFLLSFGLSFVIWGVEALVYALFFQAFGLELPFAAALVTLVVVNLSAMIPSTPGLIGVFQFACVQSLGLYGVAAGKALAFSVALHATQIVPVTLLGVGITYALGLSFNELSSVHLRDEHDEDRGSPDPPTEAPT